MIALVYIPVLHEGYRRFFAETRPDRVYLLDKEMIEEQFAHFRKDIRALPVAEVAVALDAWRVAPVVGMLHEVGDVKALLDDLKPSDELVVTDDEVGRWVEREFLSGRKVARYTPFLRWDVEKATAERKIEAETVSAKTVKEMFLAATDEANQSSDWWRRVGAAVAKDGRLILSTHNTHLPTEHEPYASGDGRALFHKGEHIDKTSAIHAEAKLIAQAARQGISLDGVEMLVTTFPCPACAKLIAQAGISKLYFTEGYAVFDGEAVLTSASVQILQVM